MIDRRLVADVVLAMMLVLPTAAFAGSGMTKHQVVATSSPAVAKAAPADRSMAERGVGLLG